MGLNDTPKGERVHIAVFGKRNAGKSSLINSITGQSLSIVSDVRGTTTDPVYKAMELLPLGPVMLIDTPGLDDEGELGSLRIKKTKMVLNKADIAVVVLDGAEISQETDFTIETELLFQIKERNLPYIIVLNKKEECKDVGQAVEKMELLTESKNIICVSARTKEGIEGLKETISQMVSIDKENKRLVGDLLEANDFVVLVVPIDSAAPKGRLILPQQQTIRDILEAGAISIVSREKELEKVLCELGKKPKLVITDSQVFSEVSKVIPKDMPLTSFSILFSRYKGNLEQQVEGAKTIETLQDGDCILIAEGCTHHRQCDDIGTVKLPRWIREYTGKKLIMETSSGTEFPEDLSKYKMIIHCGGCTLNRKEMQFRLRQAKVQNVSIVNYGVIIAYLKGILHRSLEPFEEMKTLLKGQKK